MTTTASHAGRYLTIQLADEFYGIAALKVREIIRLPPITPLPNLPDFMRGVINLRGRIIPVLDLRLKFGLAAEVSARTCIVVVEITGQTGHRRHAGLVVDAVEEVIQVADTDIEPTPDFGSRFDVSCLLGMAKIKGHVHTLLDLNRVVDPDAVTTADPV